MKRSWSLGLGVFGVLGLGSAGCGSAPVDSSGSPELASETAAASLVASDGQRARCDTRGGRKERLERLLHAPVQPPSIFAGLDQNRGEFGLTLEEAEEIDCQAEISPPDPSVSPYQIASWGDHQEVQVYFNPAKANAILHVVMNPGFKGEAKLRSRAGGAYGDHQYTIGVGTLTKDGSPFSLDLDGDPSLPHPLVTELYDAVIATFAPDLAPVADCEATAACLVASDDTGAHYIGFRSVNYFLVIQPNERTPGQMYSVWKPAR